MLSIYTPFNDIEIADVHVFRSGTVYLLTGHADEKLVVKVEDNIHNPVSTFKNAKLAMKAVEPNAGKMKRLSPAEIQALEDWAQFIVEIGRKYAENKLNNMGEHPGAKDLLEKLKDSKSNLWYKMPLADLTDADKLLAQRLGTTTGTVDKTVMTMFAEGLNAEGGIEQLGRIIAADMYNGNGDRFNPTEGSEKAFGSKTLKFKAIKNIGNVFVIGKDTQQRIGFSGHDYIDPWSGYKNYDMGMDDLREAYGQWPGEHLCSRSLRKKFVKHIIDDLELILTPNRKSYSPFRKLSSKADGRLEKGMLDGMRLIVEAVKARYSKPGAKWPANAKERCDKFSAALK